MVTPVKKVPIHLQSAQNRLLIKGGKVVNHDGISQVDVYVEDDTIKQMGNHLIIPGGTRVIDATGKFVIPGGIDANVHLQMPTKTGGTSNPNGTVTIDNFYQGTKAAIAGGTTMVVDTVIPEEGESMEEAYAKWRGWAEDKVCCDYGLKMAATESNIEEMDQLSSPEFGINTFHLDMRKMADQEMVRILARTAQLGALAQVHAESGEIITQNADRLLKKGVTGPEGLFMAHSEAAEEEAIMRATTLAQELLCPIQINHVMSANAANLIKCKKSQGGPIFCEVTPAALACDGQEYFNKCWRHAAGFTCVPPIRKAQKEQLLSSTVDKVFDQVSSHHSTYNSQQKALGLKDFTKIPVGVNGIESRMSILWQLAVHTNKMTPEEFVAMTSTVPAKMLNIYPMKGCLKVGSHADLVVWDPSTTKVISKESHNLKVDFNIFEGMECHGIADTVIVQGKIMVDEGRVRVMQGFGKFIPMATHCAYIYDKVKENTDLQPVQRSEEDMAIPAATNGSVSNGSNGAHEAIPPPTPKKSEQAEKAPSQQSSSFDLKSHPNAPDNMDEQYRNSPQRASVRVKAPPGGKSSGGFW